MFRLLLSTILLPFCLIFCTSSFAQDCGGNCPSDQCPSCPCGNTTAYMEEAAVASIFVEAGFTGADVNNSVCIAWCQSRFDANAMYYAPYSFDIGLTQINDANLLACNLSDRSQLCDALTNAQCMYTLFLKSGFCPWAVASACNCTATCASTSVSAVPTAVSATTGKQSTSGTSQQVVIIAVVVPVCVLLFFLLLTALVVFWRRYRRTGNVHIAMQSLHSSINANKDVDRFHVSASDVQLDQEIGRGAFGIVYKARWRSTPVVVKKLKDNDRVSPLQYAGKPWKGQFLQEAAHVAALRPHPNVVAVLGVCMEPDDPFILTEYVDGGALSTLLTDRSNPLSAVAALTICLDVARGLAHVHREGILHNDIASRNILISPKSKGMYSAKVSDFGISVLAGEGEEKADAAVAIRAASPELLTKHMFSTASDVWAFGVLMWEVFERDTRPYGNLSNAQVAETIVAGKTLSLPQTIPLPSEVWTAMRSCWSYKAENRPTIDDMLLLLERVCDEKKKEVEEGKEAKEVKESVVYANFVYTT